VFFLLPSPSHRDTLERNLSSVSAVWGQQITMLRHDDPGAPLHSETEWRRSGIETAE
jgi:hypothetical protein